MFGLMQFRGEPAAIDEQRRRWRLHYCGTCKTIGRQYGQGARLLLNHDAVFLAELLTALGAREVEEWSDAFRSWNCFRLPAGRELPAVLRYTAAANILLSEYKVADHAADSGKLRWTGVRRLFSRTFRKAQAELAQLGFPLEQCHRILGRQSALEAQSADLEAAASPTAEATALVFSHGARVAGLEAQAEALAAIGRRFGYVVYLLDAWEDFDADTRSGAFNPLRISGLGRDWAAKRIRELTAGLSTALADIGCPSEFCLRLRANIESRLAPQFRIVHSCSEQAPQTIARRWREAIAKTREWNTPPLAFAAVSGFAFLFPLHARMARSSSECLSLGLNLMAVGSLMAVIHNGNASQKAGTLRSCYNTCCGGTCGDCTASCCCEGCCDAVCDGCSSCDCS